MSTSPYREKNECNKKHEDVVTVEQCKVRHRGSFIQLSAISSGLVLLAVVISWAVLRADVASGKATEVKRQFDVHEARQVEATKSVTATLSRIESELKEQRKLIEKIYRDGNSH